MSNFPQLFPNVFGLDSGIEERIEGEVMDRPAIVVVVDVFFPRLMCHDDPENFNQEEHGVYTVTESGGVRSVEGVRLGRIASHADITAAVEAAVAKCRDITGTKPRVHHMKESLRMSFGPAT